MKEGSRAGTLQETLRDPCFSLDFSPYGRRPKGSVSDLKVHFVQDDKLRLDNTYIVALQSPTSNNTDNESPT